MKTRSKENAEKCGICLEDIQFQGKIDCCGHLFCVKCIKKWSCVSIMQSENTCPECKKRFTCIRKLARRKVYKGSKNHVYYVKEKNQEKTINHSEFLALLQAASNILINELNAMDFSRNSF